MRETATDSHKADRPRTDSHDTNLGVLGRGLLLALALSTAALALSAQQAPFNITEVGNFVQSGQSYADVWAEGDYAYVAHFGQRVVDIVDISDPANPVLAATYDTNVTSASAQDVKVHNGLMFVGLEQVSPGCHIVDVRDPTNPVKLTDVTVLSGVHNVFYDQGWLYLVDSSQTVIDIIDLRTYDPDSPPATISSSTWRLTNVGNQIVHDITVQDGRLYASAWDSLRVYDVTNIATQIPSLLGSVPGASLHAAWATDDGRFVVVTEEHSVGGLALYEITDNGSSITLEARDYYFVSGLEAGSVHNVVVVGNRVYLSWYAAGIQVLEIDPVTATWSLVASFDTTPSDGSASTFAGCWGVYPLLGPDKVLASDRGTGLFVLDIEPNVLRFYRPSGLPRTVAPNSSAPIEVRVAPVGAAANPATVQRLASVDGAPAVGQTLTDAGGGFFSGTLPSAACGSVIELSFAADNTLGTSFVDPPGAPTETYRVDVATGILTVLEDDFESDMGWTANNAGVSGGGWLRGDARGTGAQSEFDATGASDGFSFFTGQGSVGGSISSADVDGGPAFLTSPPMDFSGSGGIFSYSYWFFNDDENDALVVEVSINGTTWVEARRYEGLQGGWREDSFHTADFVAASDQTQIRFVISDSPNNSVTEAAIDTFHAYTLDCTSNEIFSDGFESGNTSAWTTTVP